jgi:hypothetical protein
MKLQLGGNQKWENWVNLDDLTGFHFEVNNKFPVKDNSQEIIYSSHLLEHLPQNVVDYVLNECYRALKGNLIIKIPDYELVLENWRNKNHKFFNKWGVKKIIHTWKSKGIPDNINYRCSMIFCGYWNEEYGDHFLKKIRKNSLSYHGPVPMPEQELIDLLSTGHPRIIAEELKSRVTDKNITFNHQTAWSKKEFIDLLHRHNFAVNLEKEEILKYNIPDIRNMEDISFYISCFAK